MLNQEQHIVRVREHYEAYTSQGDFICSGDTFEECSKELLDLIKAEIKMLQSIPA